MHTTPVRPLLIATWSTSIVGGVLEFALEPTLPVPLRAFLAAELERPLGWTDAVALPLAVVSLGLAVYGSVQLYRLRFRGRAPLAASFLTGLVAHLFFGPVVYNPWAFTLYAASYSLGGALIGWLYLPPRPDAPPAAHPPTEGAQSS